MPAVPGPRLAMIESEIVLGALEAFLDGPAQPGGRSQIGQGRICPRIGEIIKTSA